MLPLKAIRIKHFTDILDVKLGSDKKEEIIVSEITDSMARRFLGILGKCKGWNKELGDYYFIRVQYTINGTKKHPDQNTYYEEEYYFRNEKEGNEFINTLILKQKTMDKLYI